jgi:EamA domain-containing membrane protein RarD
LQIEKEENNNKMKSFLLSIPKGVPSIIMVLIVIYFTFANNPLYVNSLKVFPYAEQVGHFILYFVMASVLILDYAKARLPHHSKINQEMALAAVSAVTALLMEIGLMFYSGYNYDLYNVYAAALGATCAFLFYHFWLLHPFRHYLYHSIQHHWRYQHRRKKR